MLEEEKYIYLSDDGRIILTYHKDVVPKTEKLVGHVSIETVIDLEEDIEL